MSREFKDFGKSYVEKVLNVYIPIIKERFLEQLLSSSLFFFFLYQIISFFSLHIIIRLYTSIL